MSTKCITNYWLLLGVGAKLTYNHGTTHISHFFFGFVKQLEIWIPTIIVLYLIQKIVVKTIQSNGYLVSGFELWTSFLQLLYVSLQEGSP